MYATVGICIVSTLLFTRVLAVPLALPEHVGEIYTGTAPEYTVAIAVNASIWRTHPSEYSGKPTLPPPTSRTTLWSMYSWPGTTVPNGLSATVYGNAPLTFPEYHTFPMLKLDEWQTRSSMIPAKARNGLSRFPWSEWTDVPKIGYRTMFPNDDYALTTTYAELNMKTRFRGSMKDIVMPTESVYMYATAEGIRGPLDPQGYTTASMYSWMSIQEDDELFYLSQKGFHGPPVVPSFSTTLATASSTNPTNEPLITTSAVIQSPAAPSSIVTSSVPSSTTFVTQTSAAASSTVKRSVDDSNFVSAWPYAAVTTDAQRLIITSNFGDYTWKDAPLALAHPDDPEATRFTPSKAKYAPLPLAHPGDSEAIGFTPTRPTGTMRTKSSPQTQTPEVVISQGPLRDYVTAMGFSSSFMVPEEVISPGPLRDYVSAMGFRGPMYVPTLDTAPPGSYVTLTSASTSDPYVMYVSEHGFRGSISMEPAPTSTPDPYAVYLSAHGFSGSPSMTHSVSSVEKPPPSGTPFGPIGFNIEEKGHDTTNDGADGAEGHEP